MKKIAVFPGSFDPLTLGHESLVLRALPLFDEIIIAVGINALKDYYFPLEKRKQWIEEVFANQPKITITTYTGLTVDFCRNVDARYILRGLRTAADFEFERSIGQVNKKLYPEIETVFLLTTPELTAITSSVIRDVVRNNGDASQFVPKEVDLTI
ncbi:MAG: pantetheine-phosphate adenylyltransferase [Bacteroidetes bacterium]|jgi:pantetheine-phosphate adenylyltransferase|nr:pantetheine-phosphate adenylyltransferase [Bacteroidota bacterium]MBU2558991.1 pantetheine-phosphate adenylyltransferase [Bacteroidota bacterium]MDA3944674.1 pantetheine-phosphate adenylyltransferase [Bacteroidota bacterium]